MSPRLQERFCVLLPAGLPGGWLREIQVTSIVELSTRLRVLLTGPELLIFLFNDSRLRVPLIVAEARLRLRLTVALLAGSFLFTRGQMGKKKKELRTRPYGITFIFSISLSDLTPEQ